MAVQRIVCFKFKPDASQAERLKHMVDFAALKSAIPQIAGYSGGLAISGDQGTQPDYDTLHYLTFDNMGDVDSYFDHEAHQAFIAANKHIWVDVLVLNAELGE